MIDRRREYEQRFGHVDPGRFITRVMTLWRAGDDTATMARTLHIHEALAERALHAGLAVRREQQEWNNAARS